MTLLHGLMEKRSADSDLARYINRGRSGGNNSPVGFDNFRHEAVWACANTIADDLSILPVHVYTQRGTARIQVPSPQIITNPAGDGSATAWRREIAISWLIEGNAYGIVIDRDELLFPTQIEIVNPFSVSTKYDPKTGTVTYHVAGKEIPEKDLLHWPGLTLPGHTLGVSPITYASQTISRGLSAQSFGNDYFARGTKANGILAFQGRLTPEQAELAKQKFITSAQTAHEPVVIAGDVKYTPLTISPQDAQYLETENASIKSIARMYKIAPEMIGSDSGSSMTYSTVEGNSRSYLQRTLNPWAVRMEELHNGLINPENYTKLNRNAALSIDLTTRYNSYQSAIRTGFMSVNEARAFEDLPPIPDGDQTLWPPYAFGQVGQDEPLGQ